MSRRRILPLVLLLAVLAACEDNPTNSIDENVRVVDVVPGERQLAAGATAQLIATARSASGDTIRGKTVEWSSTDSTVVSISPTGLATALRAGSAHVRATVATKTGSARVTVTTNPAPQPTGLAPRSAVAGTGALTLTITGSGFIPGTIVRWNGTERPTTVVHARELRTQIAQHDLAEIGTAEIRIVNPAPGGGTSEAFTFAISEVPVASVQIVAPATTVPAGQTLQLAATTKDAQGRVLEGRGVTWSSSNPNFASISGTGALSGLAVGSVTVTATSEGRSANVLITVTERQNPHPRIASITPDSVPAQGDGLVITIRGSGFTQQSIPFWGSVSQPRDIVSDSLITMYLWPGDLSRNGTKEIRVFNGTAGGEWSNTVTFTIRGITRVVVSGEPDLWTGESARLLARGTDYENNTYPLQPTTWSSSNMAVATVDEHGDVRAHAAGQTTITATMTGKSGTMTLNVHTPPAADLLYESVGYDIPELWRFTPGAGAAPLRLLAAGTYARTPAVSRDGQMIAFAGGDGQIYVVRRDGTGLRSITADTMPKDQPAWSPDGTRIVYRVQHNGESDIGIVNVDGTAQRLLTWPHESVFQLRYEQPTWAPDGTRIVYALQVVSYISPETKQLHSMKPDGSDDRILTNGAFSDTEPAFSPNGGWLAVSRTWITPPLGRQVTLLTPDGHDAVLINPVGPGVTPSWSPDSNWLAFIGFDATGAGVQLIVTRPHASMHKQVVSFAVNPVWLPRN